MRSALVIASKEVKHTFLSPIAYAFLVVYVVFLTFMFFRSFFLVGQASMANFFDPWVPMAFALVIPGLTMRMWAEERKQGTLEFLLTAPVETWHIVVGKFLAGLALVTLCMLLTLLVPYTISRYGDLDPGPVWGSYLGAVLMGGTFLAIGMFISSFTQDQIVAFLVSAVVLIGLVLVGMDFIQLEFRGGSLFGAFCRVVSPTTHFDSIGRGVIDLRDLWYFASMSALFLYLNVRVIDLRRWR
jgi:ABC-2 type transport system permease protein